MTDTPAATTGALAPVTMLWMEPTPVGSAARTHMDGTRVRLDAAGIPVRRLINSEQAGGGLVGKASRLLRLVLRARGAAHDGVLVTRWHPFLAFVAPAWRRRGGRVLLLVQGNDASAYETNPWLHRVPGIRALMTKSLVAGDSVLVVNAGLEDWVREERARAGAADVPLEVMPSGVSDVFFDAAPVERDRPYVLFFGGLAPWQGVDYMLEAQRTVAWPKDIDLLVIGDGARAEAVESAQSDTLHWLGALPPAQLAGYVAGAVVTLCPKANTGSMAKTTTPFKILESVAAGVPVVATDIPAQAAMLQDGYGLLADVDDPEDLAREVARVVAEPALRERLAARAADVSPRFRWTAAGPQLAAAVRALSGQVRAGGRRR
ncbi:glycosyltransferase family 4 protein [Microbacterium marinilacus]|uniref:Glycosyltransferase n=1 Tax=Microbacterium marinilacus TaxID=415209 RepID=A0ABP7BBI1_9MICO|nr:glycosyltransferase family 4 protein [Microbacterium marinilacus]MBY0690188.1 glycosyltransferase family 4 protein [Microbacterium marinilacus]